MPSERPGHRIYEQWHPLGPVGVITAFNFPLAVWSWNAFLALVCGDTVVWKPSSKAALSAVAVMNLIWPVLKKNDLPDGILNLVVGAGPSIGEAMIQDRRIPLISATGSVRMGRHVGPRSARVWGGRFSNWEATTRSSSPPVRTWSSPSGRSCSAPSVPPGSAVRPFAGCWSTRICSTASASSW